jgi:hypothetical protein
LEPGIHITDGNIHTGIFLKTKLRIRMRSLVTTILAMGNGHFGKLVSDICALGEILWVIVSSSDAIIRRTNSWCARKLDNTLKGNFNFPFPALSQRMTA